MPALYCRFLRRLFLQVRRLSLGARRRELSQGNEYLESESCNDSLQLGSGLTSFDIDVLDLVYGQFVHSGHREGFPMDIHITDQLVALVLEHECHVHGKECAVRQFFAVEIIKVRSNFGKWTS